MATKSSLILDVFLVGVALMLALALTNTALAANNFVADGSITVNDVTMGSSAADLIIFTSSEAESWSYNSGAFTVLNPGTFTIGSSDTAVKSIKSVQSVTNTETCADNTTAGSSYLTLPTTVATYTITPQTVICGGGSPVLGGTATGGGGGGGGTVEGTTAIGNVDISSKAIVITLNAQANFTITPSSKKVSETHTLKFSALDATSKVITVIVQSNPVTLSLGLGETKKVDLDGDSIADVSVKYNALNGSKADVVVASIAGAEKALGQDLKVGDLVKTATNPAVYYIDSSGKRHLFSNEVTYWTWYSGSWATQTIKTVTQAVFDSLTSGANVTARPGVNLIKFQNSPKRIYAVTSDATVKEVVNSAGDDEVAKTLYGNNYAKKVILIQDAFETNYLKGAPLSVSSNLPDGSLIQYNGSADIYYINGGKKSKVADTTALTANKFKSTAIITVPTSMTYADGAAIIAEDTNISRVIK